MFTMQPLFSLPHLVRYVLKKLLPRNARVVHEQRDFAEFTLALRDHGVHLGALRHVRLHGDGLMSLAAQQRGELVRQIFSLIIVDAHGVALARERTRDCAADAAGRTGDQCNFFHALSSRSHKSCLLY